MSVIQLAGSRARLEHTDGKTVLSFDEVGTGRVCSSCTLCCKLLPVRELRKPANTVCAHQRFGKGCAVYAWRPTSCRTWFCRWVCDTSTEGLPRPDRAHYVIDLLTDTVAVSDNADGRVRQVPAVQIWVDPAFPQAHREPRLRAWLDRLAQQQGCLGLVRCEGGADDGLVLFPPSTNVSGEWLERPSRTLCTPRAPGEGLGL